MAGHTFLAFDLGAESGRAVIGNLREEKIRIEEVYRFPNVPVRIGKHVYWDAFRLWNEVRRGVAEAQARCDRGLASIGIDTWGVDFGFIDRNGELIGNPHHYRDARTEGIMEEVFKRVQREEVYSRTGVQFIRINSLYQLYSLVLDRSPVLGAAHRLLMMPDLFNHWLCGSVVSEFTDATTTQFYNPTKRDWDYELFDKLSIPTHFLPEITEPGSSLGRISRHLADDLDTSKDVTIIAPGCHDTASAVAAAPLKGENSAYISSGTWSLVGAEVVTPVITKKSLDYNFTNEGGVFGKFRLLRNVQGMWLVQECKRTWASQGNDLSYDELSHLASRSRALVAMIDPDDARFISPSNMIEEILSYLDHTGQDKPKDEGELVRIILESLALKYRNVIEQLEDLTGSKIDEINIVGGGSRNWLLNQLTADFAGVSVVAGPAEATSIGNILMQAVAMKQVETHEDLRSIVKNSCELRRYEPNPSGDVDGAYERFIGLVQRK